MSIYIWCSAELKLTGLYLLKSKKLNVTYVFFWLLEKTIDNLLLIIRSNNPVTCMWRSVKNVVIVHQLRQNVFFILP